MIHALVYIVIPSIGWVGLITWYALKFVGKV